MVFSVVNAYVSGQSRRVTSVEEAAAEGPAGAGDGAAVQFRPVKFTSSWREESLVRICELRDLIAAFRRGGALDPAAAQVLDSAESELAHARQAVEQRRLQGSVTGGAVQRIHGHLDAAEILVLRAAPAEYLQGQIAAQVVYVRRHLVRSDPRCAYAESVLAADLAGARKELEAQAPAKPMSALNRERLLAAVQGAMAEARNEQMRVRSFRNLLMSFGLVLFAMATAVWLFGMLAPEKLPVCFQPVQSAPGQTVPVRRVVCPIRESPVDQADIDAVTASTVDAWDVPLIELLGLVAAGVATATALRKVRGTSTPYSLPATLAFLKLPLGALTALLGLLLMRGNFVPGLSALDNSAQIIGWAVIFGYAQQAFTQVVDRKAQDLLADVGGAQQRERAPASPPPSP